MRVAVQIGIGLGHPAAVQSPRVNPGWAGWIDSRGLLTRQTCHTRVSSHDANGDQAKGKPVMLFLPFIISSTWAGVALRPTFFLTEWMLS